MECSDTKYSNKGECEQRKADCEAKKKETIMGCEKARNLCFKSCGAPTAPPIGNADWPRQLGERIDLT
jgi:hypothetical protein